jgi:ATP-binding cassette subfamily F protein uup
MAEAKKREAAERRKGAQKKKMSYKEQRELDNLPADIEALEESITTLQARVAEPSFYSQDDALVQAKLKELSDAESAVERKMQRWSELETRREALQ